jgi:hypothetical protein
MITYAKSEFTDISGVDWCIKIQYEAPGADFNFPFNVGPDGFVLTYDYDELDRTKPIVGSRVQFTMYHPENNSIFFDVLYDFIDLVEEGTFHVDIYRDPDGDNTLFWAGEILPEQIVIPDVAPHASVTITAVDGLGNLKGIKYNNSGTAYTGQETILQHIHNCLSKLHTSTVWTGTDVLLNFYEDFIGDEYKDHIGSGQNQQLNYAKVDHNTYHNLDQDGIKQYYSAYEVLESIALTFNASIYIAEGAFWFVPLGVAQTHTTDMAVHHELLANGTVTYNTAANTEVYTAFGNNSTTYEKLAGWERTSSPAFKEVKRVRDYQGDKPIVRDSYYGEGDFSATTIIEDEDASYSSGVQYAITGIISYRHPGSFGTADTDRACHLQVDFKLRVGDGGGTQRYLKRDVSFDEDITASYTSVNSISPPAWSFLTYEVPNHSEATWSATADTYAYSTQPFDKKFGTDVPFNTGEWYREQFTIITPELPADADGLQLSAGVKGIAPDGTEDSALIDLLPGNISVGIQDLSVHIYDSENTQQTKQVDINAVSSADARYTMNQGATLLGDKITENDLGTIYIYDGTNYVDSSQWFGLQSTTTQLSINGLGVRERLASNRTPRRLERGTLYKTGSKWIQPYTILQNADNSNNYYQVVGLSFIAARSEYDVACMYMSRNITGITVDTDNHTRGPGGPIIPAPVPVERVSNVEINTSEIEAYTNRLAGGGFRDGDGQVVVQAALGDDTSQPILKVHTSNPNTTTLSTKSVGFTSPDTMPATYTLELPLVDGNQGDALTTSGSGKLRFAPLNPQHTLQSSFYNNNSFGRYIPLGGSTVEGTTWNYLTVWPCPADGKLIDIAVWTQASTGSTDISLRKNGSGTNVSTVNVVGVAGQVKTADWDSSATFSKGDELAIYFNPTNLPYGVSITIRLEYT